MKFIDRQDEMRRLSAALSEKSRDDQRPAAFVAIWGRRRVGKSRLLIEWSKRHDGLYTVSEQSSPSVQRRYLATAIADRFPGFADVEYPDWRSLLERLSAEAARHNWRGPFIIDELPYLIERDPGLVSTLQHWIDRDPNRPCFVISGSSTQMMRGAVLDASAPLYGRASQAFALLPLPAGHLSQVFPNLNERQLLSTYALWGGTPRYWELAESFAEDLENAVDSLVLDPSGPLHLEPDRLLREESPPAISLRPLLDVIGSGAHRLSEIAGHLSKPASSLARPLANLQELGLIRREIPFGSNPRSGKRSLYRIEDPFIRLWFRVVAPYRAALSQSPRSTRLAYWTRHRRALEAFAWEELCRAAVPRLQETDTELAGLGPWEPPQRYWYRTSPEFDLVARSVDGERLLVGEAKLSARAGIQNLDENAMTFLPDIKRRKVVKALFVPEAREVEFSSQRIQLVKADAVFGALRN